MKKCKILLFTLSFLTILSPLLNKTLTDLTNKCFSTLPEYCMDNHYRRFDDYLTKHQTFLTSNDFLTTISELKQQYEKDLQNSNHWFITQNENSNIAGHNNPYEQKIIDNSDAVKIAIIGDIHGGVDSLLRQLWRLVALGLLDDKLHLNCYLICLGDYTDRGPCGSEVLFVLALLKLNNWDTVYLLKGNHEDGEINTNPPSKGGGFCLELQEKFGVDAQKIWQAITHLYHCLPSELTFVLNGKNIKFCHGGIDPFRTNTKDFLNANGKKFKKIDTNNFVWVRSNTQDLNFNKAEKFYGYEGSYWSDFAYNNDYILKDLTYGNNKTAVIVNTNRGCGFIAGRKGTKQYLVNNDLDLIIRGHFHYPGLAILHSHDYKNCYWKNIPEIKTQISTTYNSFPINQNHLVYTFGSAATLDAKSPELLGILTAETKNDATRLTMNVYENFLPKDRHNKYVSITIHNNLLSQTKNDLIDVNWTTHKINCPVRQDLSTKAKNTIDQKPNKKRKRKEETKDNELPTPPHKKRKQVFPEKEQTIFETKFNQFPLPCLNSKFDSSLLEQSLSCDEGYANNEDGTDYGISDLF